MLVCCHEKVGCFIGFPFSKRNFGIDIFKIFYLAFNLICLGVVLDFLKVVFYSNIFLTCFDREFTLNLRNT